MSKSTTTRTFLSFNYISDIKSLPGFAKGGRDKIPKEFSEYQNKLIAGWAEQTIKEHVESVATKAKNNLNISAREFQTPCYEIGTGSFNCKFFNYDFSVTQSSEDFDRCVFTGVLEVQGHDELDEFQSAIDECFEHSFDKATSSLPKSDQDLKELIYSLDDNKKLLSSTFEFSFENDFSLFQLVHKEHGTVVTVNDRGIEINFKRPEPISKLFNALDEVNKKIFLTTKEETLLLSDR